MTTRMVVTLDPKERSALIQLAEMELRDPRDQIRVILRRELHHKGLLISKNKDINRYSDVNNEPIQANTSSKEI